MRMRSNVLLITLFIVCALKYHTQAHTLKTQVDKKFTSLQRGLLLFSLTPSPRLQSFLKHLSHILVVQLGLKQD